MNNHPRSPKIQALIVALSFVASASLLPAQTLYNVQLNGLSTTYGGPGQVGASGDTWNNPTLLHIDGSGYASSTSILAPVSLVDSSGNASSVTLSISALNFKGYTAGVSGGNPVAGLNSQALKFDWNGAKPVPTVTFTLTGLPTNAPVGIYAYGAGYYSGYPLGSTWTMDAANGGAVGNMGYGGDVATANSTGMDVTLASSENYGWARIDGHTDGSGNLTVVATPIDRSKYNGAGAWWQTYINGFQLQLYSAPVIGGLTNQTVVEGQDATLAPEVTGVPAPSYQWQLNGTNLDGETNASLTLPNVQYSQDGSTYSLVASNPAGSVTNDMTLSVIVTPQISGLANQAVYPGNNVTLSATVTGVPSPNLQWLRDGTNIPSANASSYLISSAQVADSGTYSLVASNAAGTVTNSMLLTVSSSNLKPEITGLVDQTVVQGQNATFAPSVVGLPVPTLQWFENGNKITGANGTALTLTNVQYSLNNDVYALVASNSEGSVTNSAVLRVQLPPEIVTDPQNVVVTNGDSASFTVVFNADPAPTFQWYKGTTPISSAANQTATNATLVLSSVTPADMGTYSVAITNSVGGTISAGAVLTVDSTMGIVSLSPTNGATGLCYDTPLYITFDRAPVLRNAGLIQIYDSTNPTTPVDTLDMSLNSIKGVQPRSIGGETFNTYPVIINGNTAAIYPHAGVMTSNQTYFVTVDNGVFADSAGAFFAGISGSSTWSFSTKPTGPTDLTNLTVAADGSGDFVTVQGALDALPANNTTPSVIHIRNGFYKEIVDVNQKNSVTLQGQSRQGVVLFYPNNASIAPGGSTQSRMSCKVNANDVAFDSLVISNSTPQGGSQAEALMINTDARRCIINNCDIDSRQDTILANVNSSQAFFNNCRISGNFDYIWGGGNLYFLNCEIHTISGSSGFNVTAARTDTSTSQSAATPWVNPNGTTYSANGFSFVNCRFTADPGVANITLAGSNGTAGGLDSWAFCKFDTSAYVTPTTSLSNNYVFWQYQNTSLNGTTPVSFQNVQTVGVTNNDSRLLTATNVNAWFYNWTPQLAPHINVQPTNQSVNAGQSATFVVGATGIPDPTYQWFKDETNLVGTGSTLMINSASGLDIGAYSVTVSNVAGVITSRAASLDVSAPTVPPTITSPVLNGAGNLQFSFKGAAGAAGFGYRIWATTNLSLTPVTSTWTLVTNGVFGSGPVQFTDPAATNFSQRFYQITVP